MANLGQAYIHLRPYSASDAKVRALGRFAKQTAIRAASDIYGGGVEVEVELEEGSLIVRVTVIGGIFLGVYSTVADYKGFKESVIELCDDAREFAVDVCGPFVKKAGVAKEDVYRFERRLKTPGKLYRINKRLEKLENGVDDISPSSIRKELADVRAELDAVTADLTDAERAAIESKIRPPRLPPPNNWPNAEPRKLAIHREEDFNQIPFFEDDLKDSSKHKRRVVFKERAAVRRSKKRKRNKTIESNLELRGITDRTP